VFKGKKGKLIQNQFQKTLKIPEDKF
jgi:hypothetical protein